jgi:hypothetical protein
MELIFTIIVLVALASAIGAFGYFASRRILVESLVKNMNSFYKDILGKENYRTFMMLQALTR